MPAPSKGDSAKREIITMRVTKAKRDQLEAAARANGRSVSQEIEERLTLSLEAEKWVGGAETARLMRMIGSAIDGVERFTGRTWNEDHHTFRAAKTAITELLSMHTPAEPDGPEYQEAMAREEELWIAMREVQQLQARREALVGENPELGKLEEIVFEHQGREIDPALLKSAVKAVDRDVMGQAIELQTQLREAVDRSNRMRDLRNKALEDSGQGQVPPPNLGRLNAYVAAGRMTPEIRDCLLERRNTDPTVVDAEEVEAPDVA